MTAASRAVQVRKACKRGGMAGFGFGFLTGGVIGAMGLAALSLAMPRAPSPEAEAGASSAPRAPVAAAPAAEGRRPTGGGLVVPDPSGQVRAGHARPGHGGAGAGDPAANEPVAPLQNKPAATPATPPAKAAPDQALAKVPAGSEFSRAAREGAPQIPAPLDSPKADAAPAEPPAFAAPRAETAPAGSLAQPGARPDQPGVQPAALTRPEAPRDAPVSPTPEAPVPVPPPGEVQAPLLATPLPEADGGQVSDPVAVTAPANGAAPDRQMPAGPPPEILVKP